VSVFFQARSTYTVSPIGEIRVLFNFLYVKGNVPCQFDDVST
jgi:hypothetical protein